MKCLNFTSYLCFIIDVKKLLFLSLFYISSVMGTIMAHYSYARRVDVTAELQDAFLSALPDWNYRNALSWVYNLRTVTLNFNSLPSFMLADRSYNLQEKKESIANLF
jgi:hypothetical protein